MKKNYAFQADINLIAILAATMSILQISDELNIEEQLVNKLHPDYIPPAPAAKPALDQDDDDAGGDFLASRFAVDLAEEHGIDLGLVTGSGPGGKISKADVEQFIADRDENRE